MSFALDKDFEDVEPVDYTQWEGQPCSIMYSEEYVSTMGILMRLMAGEEYSERALWLTEQGIGLLASHYSIWLYRYDILRSMYSEDEKRLEEELDWLEEIALANQKNYQIWNYRQLIIGLFKQYNYQREFPILAAMLDSDLKNHHVWTYRKWFVEQFDLFDNEREVQFIQQLIETDVRNNSAWSHLFYLMFEKGDSHVKNQIEYVKEKIALSPQNVSAWNYLIGIYDKFKLDITELKDFCLLYVDPEVTSSMAVELLAQIYTSSKETEKAISLYNELGDTYDPIRKNYWDYKISLIKA
ncbi:CAAX geranylgeranyltransferase alpha subunit [Scheffersomyces spartinae]|uniref:Protein farnesyltransferase/geranylgeranyltransferase type-1 subunit alpha n=1 Tax=Scheffersomyces spartinae TaxID=45513 RepID=A0A9P7V917_9ASCO|nr:CAAX geranylgeranyltransferase alpha subunit [Scheffersomyces spartinae]KAG7193645.1 CAAX geranylgeranyltransferase alpha subunit [Scheffersomyces spartinae]